MGLARPGAGGDDSRQPGLRSDGRCRHAAVLRRVDAGVGGAGRDLPPRRLPYPARDPSPDRVRLHPRRVAGRPPSGALLPRSVRLDAGWDRGAGRRGLRPVHDLHRRLRDHDHRARRSGLPDPARGRLFRALLARPGHRRRQPRAAVPAQPAGDPVLGGRQRASRQSVPRRAGARPAPGGARGGLRHPDRLAPATQHRAVLAQGGRARHLGGEVGAARAGGGRRPVRHRSGVDGRGVGGGSGLRPDRRVLRHPGHSSGARAAGGAAQGRRPGRRGADAAGLGHGPDLVSGGRPNPEPAARLRPGARQLAGGLPAGAQRDPAGARLGARDLLRDRGADSTRRPARGRVRSRPGAPRGDLPRQPRARLPVPAGGPQPVPVRIPIRNADHQAVPRGAALPAHPRRRCAADHLRRRHVAGDPAAARCGAWR